MPPAPALRPLIVAARSLVLVPTVGFEPTRLAALAPQASVSTNSTTWANIISGDFTWAVSGPDSRARKPVVAPRVVPRVVPQEPGVPAWRIPAPRPVASGEFEPPPRATCSAAP